MMPEPAPSDLLPWALRYAQLGWPSFPVRAKAPLTLHGLKDASVDPRVLAFRFSDPSATGIGIALGFPTPGMPGHHVEVVDVDPVRGGDLSLEELIAANAPFPDTLTQQTGGGGSHHFFAVPDGKRLRGCGRGIDIKRAGGYVVVDPSLHPSGSRYVWLIGSSPFDDAPLAPAPDWLLETATAAVIPLHADGRGYLAPERIEDLSSALRYLDPDDYQRWVQVGQALHATAAGEVAFRLWLDWSEQSPKFKRGECERKWGGFRPKGINVESIFHWAQEAGWVAADNQPIPISEAPVLRAASADAAPEPAPPLPGVLGIVEAWVNATARKPQPLFATQTALAFGCAVLGRRYVTDQRNWPSLYFLNIGKSASGKEHGKWALEQLLEACALAHLVGPAWYSSDSGVLSTLHKQPAHVSVIDEFGKHLEAASVKHAARSASTLRALMEAWGRCDGTIRPQGYSTFGMSERDAKKLEERSVRNPALSILALSTPDSFFESIGSAAARDGFLNRFLIVESPIGRQAGQPAPSLPVPDAVREWATAMRGKPLMDPDQNAGLAAAPIVIPIDPIAIDAFHAFAAHCIDLMDAHELDGLAEMFGRTAEIAMRLALVIALGCEGAGSVELEHARWAIDYVRRHAVATVHRLKTAVADSEFEAARNQVLEALREHARSRPDRPALAPWEIAKRARRFNQLDKRGQVNVLESLQYLRAIEHVQLPTQSGRGRPASAYVAIEEDAIP